MLVLGLGRGCSGLEAAIEDAVLDGFGQMLRRYSLGVVQIGNCPCHFQDPVMSPGGEAHPSDSHLEGALAGIVEGAYGPELSHRDIGVVESPSPLPLARRQHSVAHLAGGYPFVAPTQFLIRHGRYFDV